MKIRIVSYEDLDGWICGKIARRLGESLLALGHDCTVGKTPDDSADINHHIIYLNYVPRLRSLHTLMVTHIDDALKLRKLEDGLKTAKMGICMSSDGLRQLTNLGIDRTKLDYVDLAHDGKAKQKRFTIGITTRLYPDGRKGESDLVRLLRNLSPGDFVFKIMGFGWAPIVAGMREKGFEVEYHEEFQYEKYMELISTLDYFLYLGKDEGSVGFIDALAAGVKTIVQPQGHHVDAKDGITHAFRNFAELKRIFLDIAQEKQRRRDAVREWTWENYARKHMSIWERCIHGVPVGEGVEERDGGGRSFRAVEARAQLWMNVFGHRLKMLMNLRNDYECGSRWWKKRRERLRGRR